MPGYNIGGQRTRNYRVIDLATRRFTMNVLAARPTAG
jgi:hypothetical protein